MTTITQTFIPTEIQKEFNLDRPGQVKRKLTTLRLTLAIAKSAAKTICNRLPNFFDAPVGDRGCLFRAVLIPALLEETTIKKEAKEIHQTILELNKCLNQQKQKNNLSHTLSLYDLERNFQIEISEKMEFLLHCYLLCNLAERTKPLSIFAKKGEPLHTNLGLFSKFEKTYANCEADLRLAIVKVCRQRASTLSLKLFSQSLQLLNHPTAQYLCDPYQLPVTRSVGKITQTFLTVAKTVVMKGAIDLFKSQNRVIILREPTNFTAYACNSLEKSYQKLSNDAFRKLPEDTLVVVIETKTKENIRANEIENLELFLLTESQRDTQFADRDEPSIQENIGILKNLEKTRASQIDFPYQVVHILPETLKEAIRYEN